MGFDAIDLVLAWEEALGVTVEDAEAEMLQTPRGAIDLFAAKLGASHQEHGACLTLRAFHRARRAIIAVAGVSRANVTPRTRLDDLFLRGERQARWHLVQQALGLPSWPKLGSGFGILWRPKTVADLSHWMVSHFPRELKAPGERWTRAEVRTVIRTVFTEQQGIRDFSDDAEFVRDLGLN